jgi:hypothetical protein
MAKLNQGREAVKALRWLSNINHEFNHSNAQKLREEDTGLWFLSCPEFKAWTDGPAKALWLHAIRMSSFSLQYCF